MEKNFKEKFSHASSICPNNNGAYIPFQTLFVFVFVHTSSIFFIIIILPLSSMGSKEVFF